MYILYIVNITLQNYLDHFHTANLLAYYIIIAF